MMRNKVLTAILSIGLLFSTVQPSYAVTRYRTHSQYVRHKRHVKTAKRVGVGAVGGAAIGALAGGGKGAAIGGIAGAGAGVLYDQYQKHHGHN
jgi:outer membrane lipoprotein SlyB